MQRNAVDFFVSYTYRSGRKKSMSDDAFIGLLVQDGFEIPDGLTRGMISEVRKYLANQHQVKPSQVTINNVVRLTPEVMDVPERERTGEHDGEDRSRGVHEVSPEIPPELAEAMREHFSGEGVVVQDSGEDSEGEHPVGQTGE